MKQFRLLAGAVFVASFVLTSCMKDESTIESDLAAPRKISFSGEITQVYQTRVNDAGFCDGDAVGIYIVDYDGAKAGDLLDAGNRADNMKHTFDEAAYKWIPTRDIYWKDNKTHIDVYGYYPYSSPDNVATYAFEVEKDQSTSAAYGKIGGYETSDFLWGKTENVAPTDKVIKLGFNHKMASARITLAEGTGFAESEWGEIEKQVLLLNTTRSATIDLATGIVTPMGEIPSAGTIPYSDGNDFRAIVVPQQVAAGTPLISITVGGIPYLFKKDEAFTYIPSKQHNFTITVNKREAGGGYEFVLTSESITAWENDNISHDATAREYIVIDVAKAGTLKESIVAAGKEYAKAKNLKVMGTINASDFYFMRDEMKALQALNIKEVKIVDSWFGASEPGGWEEYVTGQKLEEDIIPERAFDDKTTLVKVVLPDRLKGIGERAFRRCVSLTGSLVIPEGVVRIGASAFLWNTSLSGSISLPSTLEYIGGGGAVDIHGAFNGAPLSGELKLPVNLKYIGHNAFNGGLYSGSLILPGSLEFLGDNAFNGCRYLTGNIEIPQSLVEINQGVFSGCGFNGQLILHDRIVVIGENAFSGCPFRGELHLPSELTVIGTNAFHGCDFSGELVLPRNIATVGNGAFAENWRLSGSLTIPDEVVTIGERSFYGCRSIEEIVFPKDVETILPYAFENCFGIGRIVCKNVVPALVMDGAFNGVPKDNFTLEVPESAIAQYQAATGWRDFKRISAYRNLVIRPSVATAINTSVTRDLVLNAEAEWIVESQPDWVVLDKTSGVDKAELKLTFSEMPQGNPVREGEIVFKLKEKDYRTRCTVSQYNYEYAEDEIVTLQKATRGNGVNLVFLGDGYNAKEVSEGTYMKDIKEAVEHYFNIEPYKTYRDYFNIFTGIAVSPESGIGGVNTIIYNRFNTSAKGGVTLGGRNGESDFGEIFKYACKAPTVSDSNLGATLVVMIPNTTDYGGICYMYDDGSAIAYCPKSDYGYPLDFRGVIQHEAGGHGFGKLGDEYIYHNAFIDACPCSCCPHSDAIVAAHAKGWYQNLSLTGKMNEVPWSHLIFHDKYKQIVDIFEGAFMHTRGVYRSEQNSCMNNDIPYYSTISREAIVKRIKEIAGETYTFEDFVINDVMDASTVDMTRSAVPESISRASMYQHSPVMMGKRPKLND